MALGEQDRCCKDALDWLLKLAEPLQGYDDVPCSTGTASFDFLTLSPRPP